LVCGVTEQNGTLCLDVMPLHSVGRLVYQLYERTVTLHDVAAQKPVDFNIRNILLLGLRSCAEFSGMLSQRT